MTAPDRQGQLWSLAPVPWWPGKCRLITSVPSSVLKLSHVDALQLGITRYDQWPLYDARAPTQLGPGLADYTFSAFLPGDSASTRLAWNPPIAPLPGEDFAQVLVSEETTWAQYSWPSILYDLTIIVDTRLVASAVANRQPVDRGAWRDGQSVPTKIVTRVWASNAQPPDRYARAEVPMPTQIRGDYYGLPVRIPECLHPEVTIESAYSNDAVLFDCTPTNPSPQQTGNVLRYPATNHQSWRKHTFSNESVNDDGLWRRTERTAYPPPAPGLQWTS